MRSSNSPRTKAGIILGVTFMLSVAGFNSIYLPHYSDTSKRRREELAQHGSLSRSADGDGLGGSRGSMWSNMDKQIKSNHSQSQQSSTDEK